MFIGMESRVESPDESVSAGSVRARIVRERMRRPASSPYSAGPYTGLALKRPRKNGRRSLPLLYPMLRRPATRCALP